MSKVKLVVKPHRTLSNGSVVSTEVSVPENMQIVGVIRTDFDKDDEGIRRVSDDLAAVLSVDDINVIVGKLLTVIDATFVDKEQRQAMKDIFKTELWSWEQILVQRITPAWEEDRDAHIQ